MKTTAPMVLQSSIVVAGLLLALATVGSAQNYVLRSNVLDAGGVQLASAGYRAGLSLGQHFASGFVTSSGYRAVIGFWHGAPGGGVEQETGAGPSLEFGLSRSSPSPFAAQTTISYALDRETRVTLTAFDNAGRVVGRLVNGVQPAGEYRVTWNIAAIGLAQLANGVYFLQLDAAGRRAVRPVVILR